MDDAVLKRYHAAFVHNSSPVPMVNLRAAREEFPLRPKATMPIMVAGALQDTIVDVQAVKETAEALGTQAMLYNMAHDMMLVRTVTQRALYRICMYCYRMMGGKRSLPMWESLCSSNVTL